MTTQDCFSITPDVCGLELTFKTCKGSHNFLLFDNVNLSDYVIFARDGIICRKFQKKIIPGYLNISHIASMIENNLFFEMLVLDVYPKGVIPSPVDTYQEYKTSQCEMVLLLYDMLNIDVYAKKTAWLLQLLNNAQILEASNIMLKTEASDGRTGMYV